MLIGAKEIFPGDHTNVKLSIGDMPSGNALHMEVQIFRALQDGPCILLLAGIHGDEVNGVEILRQLLWKGHLKDLIRGTVMVVPIVNVYGFIHRSRELPDGKDINRSFPGTLSGSLASRIARAISKTILPLADVLIDLHTGGNQHYNYPQIRYTKDHQESMLLGKAFQPTFLIGNTPIPKSLRKTASDLNKAALVFEGGENLRLDPLSLRDGLEGILRVLQHLDMLSLPSFSRKTIYHFEKSVWQRSAHSGLFRSFYTAGQPIQKGALLGEIGNPLGTKVHKVTASRDGMIIGHNNAPLVNQGDALFHIAF